ncbi:hypothetical protein FYJ73_06790 [Prevotellaceae bacterium LKV-178-WT-2A]|uniref:Uncharacterized protein n=1 Tax=Hallella mizrahii TaxID=2606637 RepID=A0A7K0KEL4_9BACT|nr:hypothetical protein [Hallella mizrahii]
MAVSEHTPGGYLPDNIVDSLHKLPSLVCFCVLHYALFIIFYFLFFIYTLYIIHYTLYIIHYTLSP